MTAHYGDLNPQLTQAVNALARSDSLKVFFRPHAEMRMSERNIDHEAVMTCLAHGKAYEPYVEHGELRANVVHRGCAVRVVIGNIGHAEGDWKKLMKIAVVTVTETA